jgi:hypothetical protein
VVEGPAGRLQAELDRGASPSAGQDYLLHVGATYEASQAATLAWEWASVSPATAVWRSVATVLDQVHFPAPGVRIRDGRVAVGVF